MNSFHTGLYNYDRKISDERFNIITDRIGTFNPSYRYNKDGYILINLINAIQGWYKYSFNKKYPGYGINPLRKSLQQLITNIRNTQTEKL